jgi:hypothetical protein
VTTFSREELKAIRVAMQDALDALDIDATIKVGNCTYDGGEAKYTVKLVKQGAVTQEESTMSFWADTMHLDTNKIAKINGQSVTLHSYKSKAKKYPWIVASLTTDSKWKLSDSQVKRMFSKETVV